jgi:hypothetical protein
MTIELIAELSDEITLDASTAPDLNCPLIKLASAWNLKT